MAKQKDLNPIEKLLEDIETLNGDPSIKRVLREFIEKHLLMASGLILIWTCGKSVEIRGTRFSETESVWALSKALKEVLDKGLSFDD